METGHWHKTQHERMSNLADRMVKVYRFGHDVVQSADYEALHAEYLWTEHEATEHDKFFPPQYGAHLNG